MGTPGAGDCRCLNAAPEATAGCACVASGDATTSSPSRPCRWCSFWNGSRKASCNDPRGLFDFLRQVFDAGGEYEAERPIVAMLGDSMIMISSTEAREHTPAFLYVYVADADAVYRRAVEAGVHVLEAPVDMPYGDGR